MLAREVISALRLAVLLEPALLDVSLGLILPNLQLLDLWVERFPYPGPVSLLVPLQEEEAVFWAEVEL